MSFFPISFSSATTSFDTAASRFSEILGGRREEEKKGRRGRRTKKKEERERRGAVKEGEGGRERRQMEKKKREKKKERERSRKRNSKRETCETVGPVDMSSADSQTHWSMSHSLVLEGYFCLSV